MISRTYGYEPFLYHGFTSKGKIEQQLTKILSKTLWITENNDALLEKLLNSIIKQLFQAHCDIEDHLNKCFSSKFHTCIDERFLTLLRKDLLIYCQQDHILLCNRQVNHFSSRIWFTSKTS